jgi:hypothetical protein
MPKVDSEKLFKVVRQSPEPLASKESNRLMLEAIEMLQKVEREYIGRDSVLIGVNHNDPMEIVLASDLHAGSIATRNKSITEFRDMVLSQENLGVVLLGDEIEGLKQEYLNTNTARTPVDFHMQLDFIRSHFLRPLAEKGRIMAMVSGYWGHPGWAEDATTINLWRLMAEGLNIPLIRNGGRLDIRFANGHTQSMTIHHNPPGANKNDPVAGLREEALRTSESARTNGYMSGHIHQVGVGKEEYAGGKFSVYYISSGTVKGAFADTPPDRFGVKLGRPLADKLGQGIILEPRSRQQRARNYPFASFKQGQVAFDALRILNKTESSGNTKELLEQIREEVEDAPTINFYPGNSRMSHGGHVEQKPVKEVKSGGKLIENPYSKMTMRAPYDSMTYDITTKLPIALRLISNGRLGSSSEGLKELRDYQREILEDPHSLIVYLRNMIDADAGRSADRMKILKTLADFIKGTKDQTLAIMMDESLRKDSWKKGKGDMLPVAPGSYLANETGIPLIHHLSLIKLAIGPNAGLKAKVVYSGRFADKLQNGGSFSKPTYGLRTTYNLFTHEKPGFVAGGHMPSAGTMMFVDGSNAETNTPILVAPGWFAKSVDSMGKGNSMPGASPKQAIIFMPGNNKSDYLAFPTVNADETQYMKDALTLLKGLEILEKDYPGITKKVLGKK